MRNIYISAGRIPQGDWILGISFPFTQDTEFGEKSILPELTTTLPLVWIVERVKLMSILPVCVGSILVALRWSSTTLQEQARRRLEIPVPLGFWARSTLFSNERRHSLLALAIERVAKNQGGEALLDYQILIQEFHIGPDGISRFETLRTVDLTETTPLWTSPLSPRG